MKNLDFLCAKEGKETVEKGVKDKNVIQKALGILQEDGLCAFVVYLKSKSREEKKLLDLIEEFLKQQNLINANLEENEIYESLDKLILVRNVIEKTLMYALYYAKAQGEEK